MMMETIINAANLVASIIERRSVVKWYAKYQAKQQKRKDKQRAGMLVCARCKQLTVLGACGIDYMEPGQTPDMSKECVALD